MKHGFGHFGISGNLVAPSSSDMIFRTTLPVVAHHAEERIRGYTALFCCSLSQFARLYQLGLSRVNQN